MTRLFSSVSVTGGPERLDAVPDASALRHAGRAGRLADVARHLHVLQVQQALLKIPAPWTVAEPVVLDAVAVLPLMTCPAP